MGSIPTATKPVPSLARSSVFHAKGMYYITMGDIAGRSGRLIPASALDPKGSISEAHKRFNGSIPLSSTGDVQKKRANKHLNCQGGHERRPPKCSFARALPHIFKHLEHKMSARLSTRKLGSQSARESGHWDTNVLKSATIVLPERPYTPFTGNSFLGQDSIGGPGA